jgi:hypothetical protein
VDRNRIAGIAILALTWSAITGCVTTAPERDIVVLPFAAVGVMSFKPNQPVVPRARQVNAQVARLLDLREQAGEQALVAAR